MDGRKVVVVLTPEVLQHEERKSYAARFRELGLTAYGHTEDEAIRNLKNLFRRFIRAHRANGQVEAQLDRLGVEWHWEEKYPEGKPAYEDTWVPASAPQEPVLVAA